MCNCGCEALNDLDEVTTCETQTHWAGWWGPNEWCLNDVTPGTTHCPQHQPGDDDD